MTMKNTSVTSRHFQRTLAQIRHIVSINVETMITVNAILSRFFGPPNRPITMRLLRDFKAKAKALSKTEPRSTYCQHLNAIIRKSTNVGSYHEALQLAKKHNPNDTVNPMWSLDRSQIARMVNHMQMILGSTALCILTASDIDDDLVSLMRLV